MQFKNLLILASLALSSYAHTTVAQVENDINANIVPALSALLNAIDAFPVDGKILNLHQALDIHTEALNLDHTLVATTNDVNGAACPIGESDAQAILADLQALLPNIQQSLTDIVARKATFQSIPIGGVSALVQKDLTTLNRDTDALASAFIACAPADVVAAGQELQTEIDNAFGPAIAAFS